MTITTRFAPSPTGYLHLGHAHAALFAQRQARLAGGRFLLRIEDIDRARCRPEYTDAIVDDLTWLGLKWDGEVRVQSGHAKIYAAAIAILKNRHLAYPCFCSRADIAAAGAAPHGPDRTIYHGSIYPGTCRAMPAAEQTHRAAGEPHAWRLDMKRALAEVHTSLTADLDGEIQTLDPSPFGDVVISRRDSVGSYHFCATHDDAIQGVTLVTRADDLSPAAALHRLLQALMGWPTPRYLHHKLLTGPDGTRLSKRHAAATLRDLRATDHTPEHVRAMAGFPDWA